MQSIKRIRFSTTIAAPVSKVFATTLDPQAYRQWTSAFAEGSYYEGTWEPGQRIRFLSPSGDGMISEVAEYRPNEFVSVRHLGVIRNGVEDTDSELARSWAPAYENYAFRPVPEGTEVVIEQDVTEEFERYLAEAWPKALQRLKDLCED